MDALRRGKGKQVNSYIPESNGAMETSETWGDDGEISSEMKED